jgi:hypothetical protein
MTLATHAATRRVSGGFRDVRELVSAPADTSSAGMGGVEVES